MQPQTINQVEEVQQVQLPYEPIKFVYTQTIGSLEDKFREIIDPYQWGYQDILQPKVVYGKSKLEYYLFHVAPIYNWLRSVGSAFLAEYVNRVDSILAGGKQQSRQLTNNKINSLNSQKRHYHLFDREVFLYQLGHYVGQWEIAKLCASMKIKILTTRSQKNDIPKANNKKQSNHKEQQLICAHIIKKDKFTTDYVLNDFDQQNKRLECKQIYCAECKRQVPVKADIVKYPFAPYFNKYHGKDFTLITNQAQGTKTVYQLIVVYCADRTFVKSSSGVWYEISAQKKSVVSFQKVDFKSGQIFVYQQNVEKRGDKVLRRAEPVKIQENKKEEKSVVDLAKFLVKKDKDSDEQQQVNKPLINKQLNSKKNPIPQLNFTAPQKMQPDQPEEQDNEPLQDMTKTPLPIIMNKKKTERKLFKEYKKTVESLLPKPRQKDEYEREYDKGKTKKIHKNRQEFRTADFFQLYNKMKGVKVSKREDGGEMGEENKGERHDRGDRNGMQRDDRNGRERNQRREKGQNGNDDDYNQVYKVKRRDSRFGDRGRGGRGGRGGFRDGGGRGEFRDGRGRGGFRDRGGNDRGRGGFRDGRGSGRGRGRGGFNRSNDRGNDRHGGRGNSNGKFKSGYKKDHHHHKGSSS